MKNNNFDSLRLFAAMAVLFSHSWPIGFGEHDPTIFGFSIGTIAVCVFFWTSGYLVTGSWFRDPRLIQFSKARFLRIYPGLFVNTIICILFLGPVFTTLSLYDYFSSSETWLYLTNASALKLRAELPGVFGENPIRTVNGSLWTLPYEVSCYMLLVFLFVTIKNIRIVALLSVFLLFVHTVVVFGLKIDLASASSLQKHYFHFSRFLIAFFAGVLFRIYGFEKIHWLYFVFVLVVVLTVSANADAQIIKSYSMIVASCAFVVLFSFKLPAFAIIPHSWGDWSYGIYIYAFPVQQLIKNSSFFADSKFLYILTSCLLTIFLAVLSWFFIEKPALKMKTKSFGSFFDVMRNLTRGMR